MHETHYQWTCKTHSKDYLSIDLTDDQKSNGQTVVGNFCKGDQGKSCETECVKVKEYLNGTLTNNLSLAKDGQFFVK